MAPGPRKEHFAVCAPGPESSIHQDFSSDPTASDVALGRGGVSLNVRESLIRKSIVPDSSVAFSLSFAQGSLTHLAGWGLLRWREDSSTCSRVGIEFLHLDDQSLAQFARWLQQNSPISFIPKDCHSHSTVSASS